MTPNESNCTDSYTTYILLPPVQTGPYVISDENQFGSFGCTLGILEMSYSINYNVSDKVSNFYDHVVVRGCSILLPDIRNNPDCGSRTCCLVSVLPATDLHLCYAIYYTRYTIFNVDSIDPKCSNCSNNYAALFYPNSTDFNKRSFPIKILWAL